MAGKEQKRRRAGTGTGVASAPGEGTVASTGGAGAADLRRPSAPDV